MAERNNISKHLIFEYWKDKGITKDGKIVTLEEYSHNLSELHIPIIDYGEPQCFCCGKPFYWIDETEYLKYLNEGNFTWIWNNIRKAEAAHIIPHHITQDDSSDNLVILCKTCHQKLPDTTSKQMFLKYLYYYGKKSYMFGIECSSIEEHRSIVDIFCDENSIQLPKNIDMDEFKMFAEDKYVIVPFIDFKPTTAISLFCEFIKHKQNS